MRGMAGATSVSAYLIQSSTTDPYFISDYFICLPIYILGVSVNGALVVTFVRTTDVTNDRIDRITFLLACLYFLWSSAETVKYIVWLFHASPLFYQISAAMQSIMLLLVFSSNLLLSLERYITIRNVPEWQALRILLGVVTATGIVSGVLIVIFSLSEAQDTATPEDPFFARMWLFTMGSSFLLIVSAVTCLYIATYRQTAQYLVASEAPASPGVLRRIFHYCILMSASLLLFYTPEMMLSVVDAFIVPDKGLRQAWANVAHVSLALDVLASPGLVLFFMPHVRIAFLKLLSLRPATDSKDAL